MKKARLFFILQSALCVSLTLLLSFAALDIYREGAANKAERPLEWIYTPEKAAERFAPIAPLFLASLALTAAGLALGVRDKNAEKPVRNPELTRNLAVSRVAQPDEAMERERAKQRALTRIGWGAFGVCMAPLAAYLSAARHFPDGDLEAMIRPLCSVLLPCAALGFGALSVCAVLREKSMRRETDAAQVRIKEEKRAGITAENKPVTIPNEKTLRLARMALIAVALVLILAGILNGGARDVLYKAANICTECVGLG